MTIFKRFRDWWQKPISESPRDAEPTGSPQEVWQWQINCIGGSWRYKPMPQNFGLLIGTEADAEARLEASVSLPFYRVEKTVRYSGIRTYEFTAPERERHTPEFLMQTGAIRCVSRDLKLIRQWAGVPIPPRSDAPFIVEEESNPYLNDFAFHPITPQEHFIKGKREVADGES